MWAVVLDLVFVEGLVFGLLYYMILFVGDYNEAWISGVMWTLFCFVMCYYGSSNYVHMGCKVCLVMHRRLVLPFSLVNDGFICLL